MSNLIYLAGPINGTLAADSQGWRDAVNDILAETCGSHVIGIDPLRAEQPNAPGEAYLITPETFDLSSAHAIAMKNEFDVRRADVVLAYLPARDDGHTSIGTVAEIGFAHSLRKPIFLVSDDTWVLSNAVLRAWCSIVVQGSDPAAVLPAILQLLCVRSVERGSGKQVLA